MQPIAETNATQAIENQTDTSVNNNVQTTPQNLTEPTTSQAAVVQPDDTNESLDTVELKDHESVSNDDMADKSDVINVYSSGDEGLYSNLKINEMLDSTHASNITSICFCKMNR